MKIMMNKLYGMDYTAYYRKLGIYCFDFVNNIEYASELTQEEADAVMKGADYYCKMYGAESLSVIKYE